MPEIPSLKVGLTGFRHVPGVTGTRDNVRSNAVAADNGAGRRNGNAIGAGQPFGAVVSGGMGSPQAGFGEGPSFDGGGVVGGYDPAPSDQGGIAGSGQGASRTNYNCMNNAELNASIGSLKPPQLGLPQATCSVASSSCQPCQGAS